MNMSQACTPPINAELCDSDKNHPRYNEYLNYRAAMARQLVYCGSFKNWINQLERSEANEAREKKYPRELAAYRKYLRSYHDQHGNHRGSMDFEPWMAAHWATGQ